MVSSTDALGSVSGSRVGVPGHPPPLSCSSMLEPQSESCWGRTLLAATRVAALAARRGAMALVEEARKDLARAVVRADVGQVELARDLGSGDVPEVREESRVAHTEL